MTSGISFSRILRVVSSQSSTKSPTKDHHSKSVGQSDDATRVRQAPQPMPASHASIGGLGGGSGGEGGAQGEGGGSDGGGGGGGGDGGDGGRDG